MFYVVGKEMRFISYPTFLCLAKIASKSGRLLKQSVKIQNPITKQSL